jgi:hypothetical protein
MQAAPVRAVFIITSTSGGESFYKQALEMPKVSFDRRPEFGLANRGFHSKATELAALGPITLSEAASLPTI